MAEKIPHFETRHDGDSASSPDRDRLLTETELARRWRCSLKKLQHERLSGRGVAFLKLGRLVRYRLSDVEAFEQSAQHFSTSTVRAGDAV